MVTQVRGSRKSAWGKSALQSRIALGGFVEKFARRSAATTIEFGCGCLLTFWDDAYLYPLEPKVMMLKLDTSSCAMLSRAEACNDNSGRRESKWVSGNHKNGGCYLWL